MNQIRLADRLRAAGTGVPIPAQLAEIDDALDLKNFVAGWDSRAVIDARNAEQVLLMQAGRYIGHAATVRLDGDKVIGVDRILLSAASRAHLTDIFVVLTDIPPERALLASLRLHGGLKLGTKETRRALERIVSNPDVKVHGTIYWWQRTANWLAGETKVDHKTIQSVLWEGVKASRWEIPRELRTADGGHVARPEPPIQDEGPVADGRQGTYVGQLVWPRLPWTDRSRPEEVTVTHTPQVDAKNGKPVDGVLSFSLTLPGPQSTEIPVRGAGEATFGRSFVATGDYAAKWNVQKGVISIDMGVMPLPEQKPRPKPPDVGSPEERCPDCCFYADKGVPCVSRCTFHRDGPPDDPLTRGTRDRLAKELEPTRFAKMSQIFGPDVAALSDEEFRALCASLYQWAPPTVPWQSCWAAIDHPGDPSAPESIPDEFALDASSFDAAFLPLLSPKGQVVRQEWPNLHEGPEANQIYSPGYVDLVDALAQGRGNQCLLTYRLPLRMRYRTHSWAFDAEDVIAEYGKAGFVRAQPPTDSALRDTANQLLANLLVSQIDIRDYHWIGDRRVWLRPDLKWKETQQAVQRIKRQADEAAKRAAEERAARDEVRFKAVWAENFVARLGVRYAESDLHKILHEYGMDDAEKGRFLSWIERVYGVRSKKVRGERWFSGLLTVADEKAKAEKKAKRNAKADKKAEVNDSVIPIDRARESFADRRLTHEPGGSIR